MNKNEYLDRLSRLLADISYEEHEEALSYYREYIEDAGIENEQRVIEELGTPEHLAQEICEGLFKKGEPSKRQGEPISAPEVTTNGSSGNYSNHDNNSNHNNNNNHDNNNSNHNQYNNRSNNYNHTPNAKQEKNKSTAILIIIALVLTSPIWFSIACTVISMVFACIAGTLVATIGIGVAGIVCIIVGIALIITGISAFLSITVFSVSGTFAGAALIGAGLIVLALGILFIVLSVWLCGWALPALVRFIRQTISRISCKKKEAHI